MVLNEMDEIITTDIRNVMYFPKETLGDLNNRISHHFGVDK